MNRKTLEILFIEDDAGDVKLTRKALEKHNLDAKLHVVKDGESGLDYLYKRGAFAKASRPDLILLDLNLPKKDGRQLLSEIKEDHSLRLIPIITLTTSDDDADISETYALGSSTYITKPAGIDGYDKVVKIIQSYASMV